MGPVCGLQVQQELGRAQGKGSVLETAVQGDPLGQGLSILAVLLCLANITFMTEQNKDIYMRK